MVTRPRATAFAYGGLLVGVGEGSGSSVESRDGYGATEASWALARAGRMQEVCRRCYVRRPPPVELGRT